MSFKKKLIPAVVASGLVFGSTGVNAGLFTGVYVFGDSLSDAGYYRPFLSTIGVPAALVPVLGRFTTNPGPIWAELVAQNYGGNPKPSNAGGSIYAQGGAKVASDSTSTPPGNAQRPVSTQITEYLSANNGKADPHALYSVWAGANDIFQNFAGIAGGQINATTFINTTVGAEIQQIGRLKAAGAKYVLVFGLPDLGSTPQFSSLGAAAAGAATQLSGGFNTTLWTGLKSNGIEVIPVDAAALLADVRANAAAFGFTNITDRACGNLPPFTTDGSSQFCNPANLVNANAATTYLFADGVHPTSGAHAIVADFVESLIDGPNGASMLAEAPLRTREAHIRTLDTGLQSAVSTPLGKIAAFAAGDGGKYDLSAGDLNPAANTKNRSITAGVTMRASENVTLGLAIGNTTSDINMGSYGKFETDETAFSLFGAAKSGGFYLNGNASIADISFDGIHRHVKLGQVMRVASASTKGSNASGSVALGYDFELVKGFNIGPFGSFTSQKIDVNSYDEAGAGSANLRLSEQSRISRVSSLGVRASYDMGGWTPFLRFTMDKEHKNNAREVGASPLSLASGNTYTIPGFKGDDSWATGTIGIRGKVMDNVSLTVVYNNVSSKSNVKQDAITANISIGF